MQMSWLDLVFVAVVVALIEGIFFFARQLRGIMRENGEGDASKD